MQMMTSCRQQPGKIKILLLFLGGILGQVNCTLNLMDTFLRVTQYRNNKVVTVGRSCHNLMDKIEKIRILGCISRFSRCLKLWVGRGEVGQS